MILSTHIAAYGKSGVQVNLSPERIFAKSSSSLSDMRSTAFLAVLISCVLKDRITSSLPRIDLRLVGIIRLK